MPRALLILTFLILIPISLFSETLQPDTLDLFHRTEALIYSMDQRSEGSDEEQAVFSFIEDYLISKDISFEKQSLDDVEDRHSFSQNLIVRIPGIIEDEFIIAAAVDSYEESGKTAMNPALALSFINEWSERKPALSLTFIFTSGDTISRGFLGSHNFLNNYSFSNPAALLYLNLSDNKMLPEIFGSMEYLNTPEWFMEENREALQQAGLEYRIDSTALLINRAGLDTKQLAFSEFLNEDIPSISLLSSSLEGTDIDANPGQYFQYLHNMLTQLAGGIPETWENHYIYVGLRRDVLFHISEIQVLLFFMIAVSFSMLFPLFQERRISLNFKKFRKQLWTIPVIIFLCFLFFMLTTLMLEELLLFLEYKFIWELYPLYFFLLKGSGAIFLSILFINVMRGLPFPRNPHFYSYIAFIISLINLVIVLFISISFTPIMLLSLISVFLFVSFRNKSLKRLFMILSILPQFLVLIFLFSRDYTGVYEFFILSRVRGNWLLTFLTLPFICQLSSLSFYHHHYDKSRQEAKTALMTFTLGLSTAFLIYYSAQLNPYDKGYLQIVQLEDVMNLDRNIRELSLSSTDDMGSGFIIHNDKVIPLEDGGENLRIQGDVIESSLETIWESNEFLDRRLIDLTIESLLEPEEIILELKSDAPLVLYDCPFPYEIQPDLRSGRIYIGLNPPMPLNIPLVFSKNSKPDLLITALKGNSTYDLVLDKEDIDIKKRTIIKKTIRFDEFIRDKTESQ
ncbi:MULTISPECIES: Zn-dependent exopeptidase M28 [unclassified Oceanispirochaeta]|uniref:Zn-dependent exopeptidase M28 n=1 Tax=unclassified Oceanispirochaeta TaxID=2635722 RepID=UPI0011C04024|nr:MULTISPECIES: Zn-dependent exopeptidase M28 [unclassified Oceanispirochaeta]MBF9015544.1 hypothetical protein [Oceanispirochaeta sp. M2]NPD73967.1 hypothetical protein [Oceanispirochaeta sp. M1]